MTISDTRLDEFIDIYEHLYGERLSRVDARPIATNLAIFYQKLLEFIQSEATQTDSVTS